MCDSLPTRYCRFDFRLLSIWLWKIFFLKEKHQIIINKITKKTKMLPVLSIDLFIEPLFSFGSVSFGLLIYLFFSWILLLLVGKVLSWSRFYHAKIPSAPLLPLVHDLYLTLSCVCRVWTIPGWQTYPLCLYTLVVQCIDKPINNPITFHIRTLK